MGKEMPIDDGSIMLKNAWFQKQLGQTLQTLGNRFTPNRCPRPKVAPVMTEQERLEAEKEEEDFKAAGGAEFVLAVPANDADG